MNLQLLWRTLLRKFNYLFIRKNDRVRCQRMSRTARVATYPKTVTLRADKRVCSNSLFTAHFGFVTADVHRFQNRYFKVISASSAVNKTKGVLIVIKRNIGFSIIRSGGDTEG